MGYDRVQLKLSVRRAMRGSGAKRTTLVLAILTVAASLVLVAVLGSAASSGWNVIGMIQYRLRWGYELGEAISSAMQELVKGTESGNIAEAVAGGMVLGIPLYLWSSIMGVGYKGWCLSMVREEKPPLNKLFCGFARFGPVTVTRLLTGVFLVLWALLLAVAWAVAVMAAAMVTMALDSQLLMSLLLTVSVPALWVGEAWVLLRYALVDYVLLDKGLSGLDAIREGKRLMKGRFKQALVLQLSFFGWVFLSLLLLYWGVVALVIAFVVYLFSMGSSDGTAVALVIALPALIGGIVLTLWLWPYFTGAMAKFYDWAKADADGPQPGPAPGAGMGGWSGPTDYTWSSGPSSGTGTGVGPTPGSGAGSGTGPVPGPGRPTPPPPPGPWPRNPKPRRDDPWD